VRDLAWLLLSADLLRPQPPAGMLADPFDNPGDAAATVAWLRALDLAPQPLHRDLAETRITRLGRYAERLLGWFLQHGPAIRLIAAGVQVRHAGVTLGECDFLLETRRGARLHWELAVKCYLHAGDSRGCLADYVGPNLKDRFDLKLSHVLSHQLPLSSRDEFNAIGYEGPWIPRMFIKGWLFYRHGETPLDAPELDPSHGRGWWVTRTDWAAFATAHAAPAAHWRSLPRLEWLAPRRYEAAAALDASGAGEAVAPATVPASAGFVGATALAAQFADHHGPFMAAAFAQDDVGNWLERSRGFIVPDDWPQQARAYARQ
jgi:hypothetical protein